MSGAEEARPGRERGRGGHRGVEGHGGDGTAGAGFPPACVPDETGSCSICGDEGLVGRVVEVPEGGTVGRVRLERDGRGRETSGERSVALDLLEEVRPGDRVVVHMGFAIARVREEG